MAPSPYTDGQYLEKNRSWHEEDSPYKAGLVKDIIAENHLQPRKIADIGCGSGLVAELVAQAFPAAQVDGYDISPDAAKFWPARKAPNLSLKLAEYTGIDERYDIALCLDVVEHVEDYLGFLKDIRPRSRFVIFNIPLDMCVIKLVTPGLRRARENVGHLHYFNAYTAQESVKHAGYSIVDCHIASPIFHTLPRNGFQWLALLPRMALSLIGKTAAATLVGGHSLVVLAET